MTLPLTHASRAAKTSAARKMMATRSRGCETRLLLAGGLIDLAYENALAFQKISRCDNGATYLANPGRLCSPHSLRVSSSHHQRPARIGSPGPIARVQG